MEKSVFSRPGNCLVVGRRQNQSFCQCNSFLFAQSKIITLQRKITLPLTIWSLTPACSTGAQEEFSQPLLFAVCQLNHNFFLPEYILQLKKQTAQSSYSYNVSLKILPAHYPVSESGQQLFWEEDKGKLQ